MKIFILAFLTLLGNASLSQDIHFSQFYNSPLSLNPAMTGLMKEDFRLNAIYRNQWKAANTVFKTLAFGGDMNFPLKHHKANRIAAGMFFYNDNLGDGIIVSNAAYLSLAYHKVLGHSKRLKLSGGLQGGYVQKRIDYNTLFYSSQFREGEFDLTIPSGEPLGTSSTGYMNFNFGLGGTYKLNERADVFTGISFFNVLTPGESFRKGFSGDQINKLKGRFTWTGSGSYRLSEKLSLLPAILVMRQAKVYDFNAGTALGYLLNGKSNTMVQAGLWYRSDDALILMSGIRYNHINLGLSYDFTTSGLNDIKKSPTVKDNAIIGSWEVTLTYVGYLKRPLPGELTIPCRFF